MQRPEFRWVSTILGNLKTALRGIYHAIDHAKYAHRYLAEFAYRFNRRFDLAAMVPRLLRAAVTTKPIPLSVLEPVQDLSGGRIAALKSNSKYSHTPCMLRF